MINSHIHEVRITNKPILTNEFKSLYVDPLYPSR